MSSTLESKNDCVNIMKHLRTLWNKIVNVDGKTGSVVVMLTTGIGYLILMLTYFYIKRQ